MSSNTAISILKTQFKLHLIDNGVTPLVKTILLTVCGIIIMLISHNMIEMTLPLVPPSTLQSEIGEEYGDKTWKCCWHSLTKVVIFTVPRIHLAEKTKQLS